LYATKGTPSSLVAFSAAAIAIASVTWTFFDRQDRALSYWADGGDGFTLCSANCRHKRYRATEKAKLLMKISNKRFRDSLRGRAKRLFDKAKERAHNKNLPFTITI